MYSAFAKESPIQSLLEKDDQTLAAEYENHMLKEQKQGHLMEYTTHWQRFEGFAVLCGALILYSLTFSGIPIWAAFLIFFAPDLSFAGYLIGPKFGAALYNLVHIYALGVITLAVGVYLGQPVISGIGALWIAHSGFDRMLGYGLKFEEAFDQTHLGPIGKAAKADDS